MKIKIAVMGDNDEQTGKTFEIPELTDFVATTIYFKLFELCIE